MSATLSPKLAKWIVSFGEAQKIAAGRKKVGKAVHGILEAGRKGALDLRKVDEQEQTLPVAEWKRRTIRSQQRVSNVQRTQRFVNATVGEPHDPWPYLAVGDYHRDARQLRQRIKKGPTLVQEFDIVDAQGNYVGGARSETRPKKGSGTIGYLSTHSEAPRISLQNSKRIADQWAQMNPSIKMVSALRIPNTKMPVNSRMQNRFHYKRINRK